MIKNIYIEQLHQKPIEERSNEIVERKGLGHPDYIADSAAESVSIALSKYYLKEFGMILHHNVDKGLVVGGRSTPKFGGGKVDEPIYIIVAGRAVNEIIKDNKITRIPVGYLTVNAIREFIKQNFRYLDPDRHILIDYKIRPGSIDLQKLFEEGEKMPLSNDTSFGVCYAPLSETEQLVYKTEKLLNSKEMKKKLPEVGEDIKVMALRNNNQIELTIAAAMISELIEDTDHYLSVKEEVKKEIEHLASRITELPVTIKVNNADKPEKGVLYLTVTGTSAESGDDGNTGRGNRIHGLITPCRPMSMEATGGKNPVNHIGKIYNVLAKIIANKISKEVKGIKEVYVKILGQIGTPIDQPINTNIETILQPEYKLTENIKSEIMSIATEEITNIKNITDLILQRKVELF